MINISVVHTRIQFRIYATKIDRPIDPETHTASGTKGTESLSRG
jgi:hypothetical protein